MKIKAFILKDYLLSLLIVMTLFPIIISAMRLLSDLEMYDYQIQDILSINQLRERLLAADDYHFKANDVCFYLKEKENCLRFNNSKLYMYPGYLLYLNDISDLNFEIEADVLFVNYYKYGSYKRYAIAKI